ncbi:RHS repeat-associated core domain-containing protein, partial [Pseudoalteromonas atlantica]|uniref:HNH endonuclease n=1 Tax=Pseudoalteromonas atlantica TaxID=288 RepID=UPI0012B99591
INHYQYAPNPVNWVDPFGLLCKEGEKRLKRMLDTLVDNGFEKEVIDAIFKVAIACTPIDNQDISTIKYSPGKDNYRKEHIYDITGLNEENNLITLNKVNKSGEMTPVTISIDKFAEQHRVNGEKVKINPDSKPTKYHKRTVGEVDEARKAFPVQRKEYIKKYASDALNDDNHEAHNHFTPKQLNRMKVTGQVPKKYNVHHKKPIFRCDPNENPNDLDNLELLTEDFHSRENKKLHWYEEGDEPYDENGLGPNLGLEIV